MTCSPALSTTIIRTGNSFRNDADHPSNRAPTPGENNTSLTHFYVEFSFIYYFSSQLSLGRFPGVASTDRHSVCLCVLGMSWGETGGEYPPQT